MADVLTRPVLVAALSRELGVVRRRWHAGPHWADAPCRARWYCHQGSPLLVVETGVGPQAAQRALSWLLQGARYQGQPFRPSLVLAAGFSGALQPGQRVGDLVLASEVSDETGRTWPTALPEPIRRRLSPLPLRRGRILTTSTLIGEPDRKRSLGQQHRAWAVDMESASLAPLCREQDVPLVCLRVISDDVHTALSPQLTTLLAGGRVSGAALARALVRRPALLGELIRLARHTGHAARCLAEPVCHLLQAAQDQRRCSGSS